MSKHLEAVTMPLKEKSQKYVFFKEVRENLISR